MYDTFENCSNLFNSDNDKSQNIIRTRSDNCGGDITKTRAYNPKAIKLDSVEVLDNKIMPEVLCLWLQEVREDNFPLWPNLGNRDEG